MKSSLSKYLIITTLIVGCFTLVGVTVGYLWPLGNVEGSASAADRPDYSRPAGVWIYWHVKEPNAGTFYRDTTPEKARESFQKAHPDIEILEVREQKARE